MAKTVLIELKTQDNATAKLKQAEQAVSSLGKATKSSMDASSSSIRQASSDLGSLGSRLRYLSLVTGIIEAGSVAMATSFVKAAAEMEQSTIKLAAYSKVYGQNFNEASKAAQDLASTGLVSVSEASTTLANLMSTGMGIDKATVLMKRMLDTAVTSKESLTDTYGKALEKSSLGVRILQERHVDAIGVNFRLDQVVRAYGKTLGKTTAAMTTQEKQQAVVNYLMKETAKFSGTADAAAQTFSGTLAKTGSSIKQLQAALGDTLIPIIGTLAEGFTKAANSLKSFAREQPVLTGSMITGTVAVLGLVAAFAAIGAITPMVTTGFNLTANAIKVLATTSLLTIGRFALIAGAIGGMIYLVLKATGQWDKWTNAMKNVASKISTAINPIEQLGETASDAMDKITKQLSKLKNNLNLTVRDYNQGLRDWVKEHDNTMGDLKDQIQELEAQYTKTTKKIKDDFNESMEDQTLAHTRKTEDLQREIDEEVSKGLWADQTKIRDLQRELDRENEDFALAKTKDAKKRDEDLADAKETHDDKLADLKKKLEEELYYEKKYSALIAEVRKQPWLDEIQKRQQAFNDRLTQYKEELSEIQQNSSAQVSAIGDVMGAYDNLGEKIEDATNKASNMSIGDWLGSKIGEFADNFTNVLKQVNWDNLKAGWKLWSTEFFDNFKVGWSALCKRMRMEFDDAMKALGAGDYTSGVLASIGLISTAILGLKLGMTAFATTATVGFAAAGSAATGLVAMLTPVNAILAAIVAATVLVSWQYTKLQKDVTNVNLAFIDENRLSALRLEQAKKNYEQGKITKEQYDNITESIRKQNEEQANSRDELDKNWLSWSNFVAGLKNLVSPIASWFSNVWAAVTNAFESFKNILYSKWVSMTNSLQNALSSAGNAIKGVFSGILDGIIDKVNGVISKLNSVTSKVGVTIPELSSTKSSSTYTPKAYETAPGFVGPVMTTTPTQTTTKPSVTSNLSSSLSSTLSSAKNLISSIGSNFNSSVSATINSISSTISKISSMIPTLKFETGGVVPGSMGSAVPIIAHAGETILPAGASPIVININNPSVRSETDIENIAKAVKQVISREQVLKKFM